MDLTAPASKAFGENYYERRRQEGPKFHWQDKVADTVGKLLLIIKPIFVTHIRTLRIYFLKFLIFYRCRIKKRFVLCKTNLWIRYLFNCATVTKKNSNLFKLYLHAASGIDVNKIATCCIYCKILLTQCNILNAYIRMLYTGYLREYVIGKQFIICDNF